LLARCPADVLDCLGRTGLSCLRFLFHLHSPTGHYDEPEILSYEMPLVCSIGADVRQFHIRSIEETTEQLTLSGFVGVDVKYFDEGTNKLGEIDIPVDSLIIRAVAR
jgi:hypothetical protein